MEIGEIVAKNIKMVSDSNWIVSEISWKVTENSEIFLKCMPREVEKLRILVK